MLCKPGPLATSSPEAHFEIPAHARDSTSSGQGFGRVQPNGVRRQEGARTVGVARVAARATRSVHSALPALDLMAPPTFYLHLAVGAHSLKTVMLIYIESTIPSYIVARPARDILQAARQQLTRDWWELKRHGHELFTSQVVLDEITFGDQEMARLRLELVQRIPLLDLTEGVGAFAQKVLDAGVLPPQADRDAAHIALATVHQMEFLLSWNCRHIANASIQPRLRRLAESENFNLPVICTPEELME